MRRIALVCLTVVGMGFADRAPAADQAPPASIWSGVYFGASIGGGWARSSWNSVNNTTLWGDAAPWDAISEDSMNGVVGGLQVGFNYPIGQGVFGLETQVFPTSISGEFRYSGSSGIGDDQFDSKINALVLGTARVGRTFDRGLGYLKAGYAFAQVKTSASDTVGPNVGAGSSAQWQTGPTVGIGFEYAVTSNVSVGLEYDYIWLNDVTHELGDSTGSYPWKVDVNAQLFLARLNYRLPLPR